ncbi:MAG TPA: molybdopterin cofactor-binding domain-containing protein [Burkholderiaceae bacterium]|nr:molybdopterin cofactor-binding domain-containing protein [Burkholderiaceae bacterium]
MKRRTFLIGGLVVAGGAGALLVGVGRVVSERVGPADALAPRPDTVPLNGWVRIGSDGLVTVVLSSVEMGQGVSTALPMLVAEELDVPLAMVRTEPAPWALSYGNRTVFGFTWWFHPDDQDGWLARRFGQMAQINGALLGVQVTGGSTSVRDAYETLPLAAASARAMLIGAACARWGALPQECTTSEGAVVHASGKRLAYGALALEAAKIPVAASVRPKAARQRTLVGTSAPRVDIPSKVSGTAIYGADVRLPGMLFAAVRGCPVFGGSLAHLDADAALRLPGVVRVLAYAGAAGCAPGVAAVARDSWQAQLAASACKIEWNEGEQASLSGEQLLDGMRVMLDGEANAFVFHERGRGAAALEGAARLVQADYSAPWLAHATMEPMNCTVQWLSDGTGERLKLWAPTQAPSFALDTAVRVSGIARERIDLVVTQLGGGFGRRLETDYLVPAIALARATPGTPLQVQWSREEDMAHDFYRPAAVCRLKAGLDAQGRVIAWVTRSVSDAVTPQFLARNFPMMATATKYLPDRTQAEGIWDQPYEIPNRRCAHVTYETPVPIGNWRSVGHSHMAFFAESFIDELAHTNRVDPLSFRRGLLTSHPRHRAVLELAAQKAGWGEALPAGHALGIALHESFDTIVAQVAQVSIDGGRPRVHRVVCALDCGTVIHPDIVAQQVEGSVIFALSACLYGEISFLRGRVQQSNFPQYEMVRMRDAPRVETWIVPSDAPPTGVGEPATPPLAPAVANALYALTGTRLRSLPLRLA